MRRSSRCVLCTCARSKTHTHAHTPHTTHIFQTWLTVIQNAVSKELNKQKGSDQDDGEGSEAHDLSHQLESLRRIPGNDTCVVSLYTCVLDTTHTS